MLLDAAMAVLRSNQGNDAPVAAILEESDLSTRSFYRHFASKDEILAALFRRDAESAARRVERRVNSAPTTMDGLRAWIDEILGFRRDPRRAGRVAAFSADSMRRAEGYQLESEHAWHLLMQPLVEVLERGRDEGVFPRAEPELHAAFIAAVVADVSGLRPGARVPDPDDVSVDQIVAFCLPGLGGAVLAPARRSRARRR